MKLWPWSAIKQLEAEQRGAGLIVAERNDEIRELVNGRVQVEAELTSLQAQVKRMRSELARLQSQVDGRAERGPVPPSIASARTPKADQHAARAVAQVGAKQADTPADVWAPLLTQPGIDPRDFMFMGVGAGRHGAQVVHLYKNRNTREYLNLDASGQRYAYRRRDNRAVYEPVAAPADDAPPASRRDDDTPRSIAGLSERADDAAAFRGAGGAFAGAGAAAMWDSGNWNGSSGSGSGGASSDSGAGASSSTGD